MLCIWDNDFGSRLCILCFVALDLPPALLLCREFLQEGSCKFSKSLSDAIAPQTPEVRGPLRHLHHAWDPLGSVFTHSLGGGEAAQTGA